MEEECYDDDDQQQKHSCKICNKSFPSGRSLGGHMRSHILSSAAAETSTGAVTITSAAATGNNYLLRENPKKSWRFSNEESKHVSRDCGKIFPSSRSLFGHMRSHSCKLRQVSEQEEVLEEQEGSWSVEEEEDHHVVDHEKSSSVISFLEYEKEQADVALSLMMLSRDSSYSRLMSIADESSDKNSVVNESNGVLLDLEETRFRFVDGFPIKQVNKVESIVIKVDEAEEIELKKMKRKKRKHKQTRSVAELQKKLMIYREEGEENNFIEAKLDRGDYIAKVSYDFQQKRNRYECSTCSKVFDSYQALGGHRASHKRSSNNSCLILPSNSSTTEVSIETTEQSLLIEKTETRNAVEYKNNKGKQGGHECPICGKVFPSGQALGGHKRSHVIAAAKTTTADSTAAAAVTTRQQQQQSQSRALPVCQLFDLNLPAGQEDEKLNNNSGGAGNRRWWAPISG